jgi:hypothetical protein
LLPAARQKPAAKIKNKIRAKVHPHFTLATNLSFHRRTEENHITRDAEKNFLTGLTDKTDMECSTTRAIQRFVCRAAVDPYEPFSIMLIP